MQLSEFDYDLPEELIAQKPLPDRDASRMLVLDRSTGLWRDSSFSEFPLQLKPNDVVVVNNSRVIPARLIGQRKETGGRVEVFLVRELEPQIWQALVRPSARLRRGARAVFGNQQLEAEFLDEPGGELRRVRFESEEPFETVLSKVGSTPLPPYIKRPGGVSLADDERYQTIYSKKRGAILPRQPGSTSLQTYWQNSKAQINSSRLLCMLATERLSQCESTTLTNIKLAARDTKSLKAPPNESTLHLKQVVASSR